MPSTEPEHEESEPDSSPTPGPDEAFCSSCGSIIKKNAEICPECGVRQEQAPGTGSSSGEKNPGLAAVASFFFAGLGQIYNGQITKGLLLIGVQIVNVLLMFVLIGFFTYFVVWVFGIYDAYKVAERINAGEDI